MTSPPDWIRRQVLPILHQGKNVLAVEGDDDKDVYTAWLKKLTPCGAIISDKVVIVSAGDKMKVLNALEWQRSEPRPVSPEIYGLVDRDEWDAATIAVQCAADPRLLVNPSRHCLESYFVDPQEIEAGCWRRTANSTGPHRGPSRSYRIASSRLGSRLVALGHDEPRVPEARRGVFPRLLPRSICPSKRC